MVARILIMVLAALLAAPIAETARPAKARKSFKNRTITRTVISTAPIVIPEVGNFGPAIPFPATIEMSRFKKKRFRKVKIKDVNLTLHTLTHTKPDDIDLLLAAPNGRNALLMSDAGGGVATPAFGLTLTLDDAAAQALPDNSQLTSGVFRPFNGEGMEADVFPAPAPAKSGKESLAAFNGTRPHGEWALYIHDDVIGGNGVIAGGWSLEITAKVKVKKKRH